ncbi:hypothetical protein [Nonomuraea sp. NPDC002799]
MITAAVAATRAMVRRRRGIMAVGGTGVLLAVLAVLAAAYLITFSTV